MIDDNGKVNGISLTHQNITSTPTRGYNIAKMNEEMRSVALYFCF